VGENIHQKSVKLGQAAKSRITRLEGRERGTREIEGRQRHNWGRERELGGNQPRSLMGMSVRPPGVIAGALPSNSRSVLKQ